MSPLISVPEFIERSNANHKMIILDCRADLSNPNNVMHLYNAGHIPNAIHAHLENDLSGPILPGKTGRHPLPSKDAWQMTLQKWGVEEHSTVVVYDQNNGMFAARAWWMLNWAGITKVQVLDGGLDAWLKADQATSNETPQTTPSAINISLADWVVEAHEIHEQHAHLIDARALPRYTGEVEPLDPKAGHIPGALNADFSKNLTADGLFQSPSFLRKRFDFSDQPVICYCGSGVTACHNILAFAVAGLPIPKLYAGSWSEWITDPQHATAQGIEGTPL